MQKSQNRNLLLARIAVSITFFTLGAVFGNWGARIPDVKETLELSEAQVGLVLMCFSIGVIFGSLITSGLIARFGSKNVSLFGAITFAITLGIVGLSFNFLTLAAGLFFFGMCNISTDVAMNAQAVEVETRSNKQIMNSFHAFWSVGLFSGAVMGSIFVTLGFNFRQHFLLVPIFFIILMVLARNYLLNVEGEQSSEEQATFQFPPRALWGLGVLAFASGLSEGAIIDWSTLYFRDIVGTSEAVAALGLAAFSFTMLVMRFAGDFVADKIGASLLVRIGGVGVVIGVGMALLFATFWTTIVGFMISGIGLAVAIPLAFSAAGKIPDLPSGRAIAGVATIGYAAFLIGPVVIGFIADATSLRIALIVIMVLAATMVYTGGQLNVGKRK